MPDRPCLFGLFHRPLTVFLTLLLTLTPRFREFIAGGLARGALMIRAALRAVKWLPAQARQGGPDWSATKRASAQQSRPRPAG